MSPSLSNASFLTILYVRCYFYSQCACSMSSRRSPILSDLTTFKRSWTHPSHAFSTLVQQSKHEFAKDQKCFYLVLLLKFNQHLGSLSRSILLREKSIINNEQIHPLPQLGNPVRIENRNMRHAFLRYVIVLPPHIRPFSYISVHSRVWMINESGHARGNSANLAIMLLTTMRICTSCTPQRP